MTGTQFPDQFAVDFIRDSLWKESAEGRASVMVGSGFSRNARATSPSARAMPTWAEMSQALCGRLYASSTEDRRQKALREAESTSGFLRLAQEYQAAFGRISLNEQIKNLVPDLDYEPDDLHYRLLNLPWRDVLTTNWDTLLERTTKEVFQRNYDVVRTPAEIPYSSRNRIVKLHGSFPSNDPFIFTEEDYRHYPKTHAPFVNLVQQSLMESTLCLVGFSGDDPNFLHWSGWVRDNLGVNCPKIYLVGWLDLSPHRRRMLEDRNVVPIDLAYLPIAKDWPKNLRHNYATEWFIRAISVKKRFDAGMWPRFDTTISSQVPSYLGALPLPAEILPRAETISDLMNLAPEEKVVAIRELVKTWEWNRKLYPGWLIAPFSVREQLWMRTHVVIDDIVKVSGQIAPLEYLGILNELIWRLDVALAPHFSDVILICEETIAKVDIERKLAKDSAGTFAQVLDADWGRALVAWRRLALMIVRSKREDGKLDECGNLLDALERLGVHEKDLLDAVINERCLILYEKGQFPELEERLANWNISSSDAAWALRKAGLYTCIGEHRLALKCALDGLQFIRINRRRDCIDYSALSRESWALWFQVANLISPDGGSSAPTGDIGPHRRWLELGVHHCNSHSDYYSLLSALQKSRAKKVPSIQERRRFDLGRVTQTFNTGQSQYDSVRHSYALFRLGEFSGVPGLLNNVTLLSEGLSSAIPILGKSEVWACSIWAIRLASSESDENVEFFSRSRVAMLSPHHLLQLINHLQGQIEFFHRKLQVMAGDSFKVAVRRMKISLEILSRLIIRSDESAAKTVLTQAIRLISDATLTSRLPLREPLVQFLARAIEASSIEVLASSMVELLSLRLIWGRTGSGGAPIEITQLIPRDTYFQVGDTSTRGTQWEAIVNQLCLDIVSDNQEFRTHAQLRFYRMSTCGLLTNQEQQRVASIFWREDQVDNSGLPLRFSLEMFAILGIPEIVPGNSLRKFKAAYLSGRGDVSIESVRRRVYMVSNGVALARSVGSSFELSDEEKQVLCEDIKFWAQQQLDVPRDAMQFFGPLSNVKTDIDFLADLIELIPLLPLDRDTAELVWGKLEQIEPHKPDGILGAFSCLLSVLPEKATLLERRYKAALVSQKADECRGACFGVFKWVRLFQLNAQNFPKPGDALIEEIANGLATRRSSVLATSLDFFAWLFTEGPQEYRAHVAQQSIQGLGFLMTEAAYDGALAEQQNIDIPALRFACVRVAVAMAAAGYAAESVIREWLEISRNDPLPEVRKMSTNVGSKENPIRI